MLGEQEAPVSSVEAAPEFRKTLFFCREMVLTAYAPETSMKEFASQLGRTEGSLYQLLSRIRQELLRCIERTLGEEARYS